MDNLTELVALHAKNLKEQIGTGLSIEECLEIINSVAMHVTGLNIGAGKKSKKLTTHIIKNNIEIEFRQDYININHTIAISAEGVVFKIGDIVGHEGAKKTETATIVMFSIHHGSNDIIAHTNRGYGRISFIFHLK